MNYTKPFIIMLGLLILVYFFGGNPNDPAKQAIENQKLGKTDGAVTNTIISTVPTAKVTNTLIEQYKITTKSGNYQNLKILKLYEDISLRGWSIRQAVKKGDVIKFEKRGDDLLLWQTEDIKDLNDFIKESGYTDKQVNQTIKNSRYKGTIESLRMKVQEDIEFLKSLKSL